MKKRYIIGIVISAVIILAIIILTLNIQKISTDKKTYAQGEPIKIRYSSLYTIKATCLGNFDLLIYKKEGDRWTYQPYLSNTADIYGCLNDNVVMNGLMYCDVIMPTPMKIEYKSDIFTWDQKAIQNVGNVSTCGGKSIAELTGGYNDQIAKLEYVQVPSGQYKIVYGNAEKIINIEENSKPASLGKQYTLRNYQTAVFEDEGLNVTVTGLIYAPCPKDVMCIWSGMGVNLRYDYQGNMTEGMNLVEAFGYSTSIVDTDYKTYATLKTIKI